MYYFITFTSFIPFITGNLLFCHYLFDGYYSSTGIYYTIITWQKRFIHLRESIMLSSLLAETLRSSTGISYRYSFGCITPWLRWNLLSYLLLRMLFCVNSTLSYTILSYSKYIFFLYLPKEIHHYFLQCPKKDPEGLNSNQVGRKQH